MRFDCVEPRLPTVARPTIRQPEWRCISQMTPAPLASSSSRAVARDESESIRVVGMYCVTVLAHALLFIVEKKVRVARFTCARCLRCLLYSSREVFCDFTTGCAIHLWSYKLDD